MKLADRDLTFRPHARSDTDGIVAMINRDPYHMLNGITAEGFEQDLDEPGERIRDHTFIVAYGATTVGYLSLCFVERNPDIAVYCFGTVDIDWRRRGIGTAMFKFVFARLQEAAKRESRTVRFIHRALTRISGETALGLNAGMQEQNSLEIMCLKDLKRLGTSKLPPEFQIRAAALDDAAGWADVYNDAFGGHKTVASVIHEFQGADFSPLLYLLCVRDTGEPVGLICSTLRGTHARVPTIAIKREWQRRGIGEALLSELLHRLRQAGAADVRLSVESNNRAAKLLYAKLGFHEDDKRIHYAAVFAPPTEPED